MALYPTTLGNLSAKNLFPTPLIVSELPPDVITDLNPILKQLVLSRAKDQEGVHVSNQGGWQSDDQLPAWGGEPVAILLSCIKQLLDEITLYHKDSKLDRVSIDWKINGWANINRDGHFNGRHIHPGAYWSAVYYVSIDQQTDGGELELFDPRGSLPLMYCPVLRMGLQGYVTAGNSELHKPKEGQCVIFPSWLAHAVRPYNGGTRISLAFNFSV